MCPTFSHLKFDCYQETSTHLQVILCDVLFIRIFLNFIRLNCVQGCFHEIGDVRSQKRYRLNREMGYIFYESSGSIYKFLKGHKRSFKTLFQNTCKGNQSVMLYKYEAVRLIILRKRQKSSAPISDSNVELIRSNLFWGNRVRPINTTIKGKQTVTSKREDP